MTLETVPEAIRSYLHSLLSEKLWNMAKRHKTLPPNGCLFPHNSKIQSITFIFANVPATNKECATWLKCAISIAYACHRLFRACLKYDQGIFFRSDLIASVRETRYKINHRPRHSPAVEKFEIDIPAGSPGIPCYKIEIPQCFNSLMKPLELPEELKHIRKVLFGNSQQPWVRDYLIPLSTNYHISLDISQETRPKNLKGIFLYCFHYLSLMNDLSTPCSLLLADYYFNKCIEHCRDCNIALTLTSPPNPPIVFPPLDATQANISSAATQLSESASKPSSPLSQIASNDIADYFNPAALQISTADSSTSARHPRSDSSEFSERSVRPRL